MSVPHQYIQVVYSAEKDKIKDFLTKYAVEIDPKDALKYSNHTGTNQDTTRFPYLDLLQQVADRVENKIEIDLDDVQTYEEMYNNNSTNSNNRNNNGFQNLCLNIENNTKRYVSLFQEVIDSLLPVSDSVPTDDSDPLEVILYQRRQRDASSRQESLNNSNGETQQVAPENIFPPMLTRRYNLTFKARSSMKAISVREIKGSNIGKMVNIRAIVTRVGDVKPQAVCLALSCDTCGCEVFQEVTSNNFLPLVSCPSLECKKNSTKGKLYLQTRASKLIKFQEIRIQELTDQIPMGHIPRSMSVHLYESLTRTLNPGDTVYISGIFLPTPYTGYKAIRAGLITDTYLEAQHVNKMKKSYSQMEMTPEIAEKISELSNDRNVYSRLARSIAPEIWGCDDVKKALLLLLVGGSSKETNDGMKIRGDINVCLMGDPGVAKSQLLKQIANIAPRGVYTTGRGSSGVGLTASVTRDPITDEMILEGGALVLADNGIACIDEFDKMEDSDRTAIHEVMEQQTISISKAGINTTLNARTSILAAANPQYGRYNPKKKVSENINLPAALLSRFDILFLMLDTPTLDDDLRLAKHVAHVHMYSQHPQLEDGEDAIDLPVIRHFIARAKRFNPTIPRDVADYIINAFADLRSNSAKVSDFQYTSARTLLSVVRLSTGLARIKFEQEVDFDDIDEALRLIHVSKASLLDSSVKNHTAKMDTYSAIYSIIRQLARKADGSLKSEIPMSLIQDRILAKGYTLDHLNTCLESYQDVLMVSDNGTTLRL